MKHFNGFIMSLKCLLPLVMVAIVFVCGCDAKYKDEINGIQEEIDAVKARIEQVVDEVNSEIEALTVIVRSTDRSQRRAEIKSI